MTSKEKLITTIKDFRNWISRKQAEDILKEQHLNHIKGFETKMKWMNNIMVKANEKETNSN